jgi:ATP-dependent RNA helicase DDX10/DBP4
VVADHSWQAFVSYMRSVYLQKNKGIFKLTDLPAERFAEALGLPGAPRIKFLSKSAAMLRKNVSRDAAVDPRDKQAPDEGAVAGSDDSDEDTDANHEHSSSEGEAPDQSNPISPVKASKVSSKFAYKI